MTAADSAGGTPRDGVTAPSTPLRTLPRWLVLAVASVFVFIAGMCVSYGQAVRLDARLQTATRALRLAELENSLAAAGLESRQGRYETARQLASQFFTGLQEAADDVPADARDDVRTILAHRDSAITVLSRGAAASTELLDRLLMQYRGAVRPSQVPATSSRQPRLPGRPVHAHSPGDVG